MDKVWTIEGRMQTYDLNDDELGQRTTETVFRRKETADRWLLECREKFKGMISVISRFGQGSARMVEESASGFTCEIGGNTYSYSLVERDFVEE